MATFVLVHGAWHGGWCFERLARELSARGHEVLAPDLPCDEPGLTVHDYAAAVKAPEDAIVVGHSMAGLTLAFVPARLSVFLAALVPTPDVYSTFAHPDFTGSLRDEAGRSYWPDEATAARALYPDLDAETAAWAFSQLRRQARLPVVEQLPANPCAYIVTGRDRAVSPEWQAKAAREVLGVEPVVLDAGHTAMITHAAELAELLDRLA